jgi:2-polyprenyl-3-methyl-5-hydroxy-6-metoxy-1,4-benzoquinol methylase
LKTEWFETFFQGPAVEFWTRCMPPAVTLADVDFIQNALQAAPGARLLDVPCGHGRHSIELARRGYRVTGIDLSQEFLAAARKAAIDLQVEVDLRSGDMRSLRLEPEAFDGAFCFGNSFCYLDHVNAGVFLESLAAAIKPGGRLAIETATIAETILPALLQKRWYWTGDILVLSECKYVAAASRMDIDYTFIRGSSTETRPTSSYVFTAAELGRMLQRAGFEVTALYGSVAGEPFQLGSRELVMVATRR